MKITDKNKYLAFSENDFLCDEFFQDWVLNKDEPTNLFWQQWLKDHPEKQPVVETARAIIAHFQFKKVMPDKARVEASLADALRIIGNEPVAEPVLQIVWRRRLLKIAAILILLLGSGVIMYQLMNKEPLTEMATSNAIIKDIILPDSSSIVLNANSKISFNKDWAPGKPREIWLEWEAYFNVKHLDTDNKITENERFLVHVKDVTVEVLGTTFNVRERRGTTSVVLQSGKIRLLLNDPKHSALLLKPGQLVSIENLTKSYTMATIAQPEELSAWVNKKLILTNASLKEIIPSLEDYYGINIVLSDSALINRKIEGTIMLDNLDDALFVLSNILNVKTIKQNNKIFFMPK